MLTFTDSYNTAQNVLDFSGHDQSKLLGLLQNKIAFIVLHTKDNILMKHY